MTDEITINIRALNEEIRNKIQKGLKQFEYYFEGKTHIIYAINQKNADKKARKLKLI